jgi:uncharacterized protein (TIGR03435 family)
VSIVKVIPLLFVMAGALLAQTAKTNCMTISSAAAKLEFDAASVKPAGPFTSGPGAWGQTRGGPGTDDPGRFTTTRTTLYSLILRAYGLGPDQVFGPQWFNDAVNDGYAVMVTMPAKTTPEEFCGMLRNLLTQRFHLMFHYEKQARPGYELVVMPGGPKIKPFTSATSDESPNPVSGVDANGFLILSTSSPTGQVLRRVGTAKSS